MIDHRKYEYITNSQLDRACKRQEKKNLATCGKSTSFCSMLLYIQSFLVEYQSDRKIWIVKKDWRDAIRQII